MWDIGSGLGAREWSGVGTREGYGLPSGRGTLRAGTSRCESPDIVQDDQIADKIDSEETTVWQRARVQGDKVMWLTTASKDQVTATSTVGWIESNCYKS